MSEWGIDLNCFGCIHYHLDIDQLGTCEAYPRGIPHAIVAGEFDHRKHFVGDKGIVYATRKAEGKPTRKR